MTETRIPKLVQGQRYPFDDVTDGDTWIVGTVQQSESVQNAFAGYASRNKLNLRAVRETMPDSTVRVSFIAKDKAPRPDRARSMEARARILERQVRELIEALNAMGAAFAVKASTDAEKQAVSLARNTMTTITAERGKP